MNFKEKVLNYLNINYESLNEYLKPVSELDYGSPFDFIDMQKAKDLVLESINNDYKVMVYGDYDADGIMSTSIIVNLYKYFNKTIGYYIPSRTIDGYGINLERAKQIVSKGYKLVITVDNGVSQFEALKYLKDNNVKVLLTDHHTFKEELPLCDVFIHPFNKLNKEENCGAYVSYMLAEAVLNRRDDYLLTLASLATISDLMPLNMHNRNLVRIGLSIINNTKNHPFHYLFNGEFDEETFGFQIAPKINAFGRMIEDTSINRIISLFTDDNISKKYEISSQIEVINTKRKAYIKEKRATETIYDNEGVVVYDPTLKEGLVGLVCNKYLSEYKKPCIALTCTDNDILKGSARSYFGAPLNEFFEINKDMFLTSGGHALAGGLSIKKEDINEFIERFNEFIKSHPYVIKSFNPIEIDIDDITVENYAFLRSLSPFGTGFEEPYFKIKLPKDRLHFFSNHVKSSLNNEASLIAFNVNEIEFKEENIFIGKMKKDNYNTSLISFVVNSINEE